LPDRLMFEKGSIQGMENPQGVIISMPIAERLGAEPGDRILVQMKTWTGQNNVGEFAIAGITVDTGLFGNISGYANKVYVNELLNLEPGQSQEIGFYLPSLDGMDTYGAALAERLSRKVQVFKKQAGTEKNSIMTMMAGNKNKDETWAGVKYRVFTLDDMLSQVRQIVNVLDIVSLVILIVLFLIVMVGITNTFRIIMFERIREIGTMRAIGMQRSEVRNLFLFEALFLALGGAIAGVTLAFVILAIASTINFGLDSPLFMVLKNGHMTFKFEILRILLNIGIVSVLTLFAAWLPARSAAKLDPADALRSSR
jgi:putative ABC transport system permease protein